MNKTNDELMLELIKAKKEGLKIVYGDAPSVRGVKENHVWDLHNRYRIIRPREYIVCIPNDGRDSFIKKTTNDWTRSDFGTIAGGAQYILMREVFKEDM